MTLALKRSPNMDLLMYQYQTKRRGRVIAATMLVSSLILASCVSTELNNQLGTEVVGKGTQIEFTWDADHPFAQQYARQNIVLVAEYLELDQNGRSKPVRQILSRSNNQFAEIRKKVFSLPAQLRSIPASANVCLYLQMNRQAIPLRNAGNFDTARFQYAEWAQLVASSTGRNLLSQDIALAERNLAIAERNLETALIQQNQSIDDFNQQLASENLAQAITIYDASDCKNISVAAMEQNKPFDVLEKEKHLPTALNVCAARAFNSVLFADAIAKQKIPSVRLLPSITKLNKGNLDALKLRLDDARKQQLQIFTQSLVNFVKNTNSNYKPEIGSRNDLLPVSSYTSQRQEEVLRAMSASEALSNTHLKLAVEVASNELEEFRSCVVEGQQQLQTKYEAWQKRLASSPDRVDAKSQFILQKCESLFTDNQERLRQFKQQEQAADEALTSLQARFDQLSTAPQLPAQSEVLNQQVCSLSSSP